MAGAAVLVPALLGLAAPAAVASGPEEGAAGGTFTMAVNADPGALDPAQAVGGATNLLLSFAYDTLVYVGDDGDLLPGLATSWEVTPDSVMFTLHPDATCSDGSPVTAETVARSIDYLTDPETASPLLGVVIPAGVTAEADVDAGTVTLQTPEPSVFLLHSMIAVFIICGPGLDDPSILADQTSGSGPYELVESVADDHYTLQAREGYTWGADGTGTADPGVPGEVVLQVVTNESTAANLLLSGDVDAGQFTGVDRTRVESTPGILTTLESAGNNDLFYNQAEGLAGADPAVRMALTQAIDVAELGPIASEGFGIASTGLATLSPRPCRVDSVAGHLPEHDSDAAAATLEEAGWIAGDDGVRANGDTTLAIRVVYSPDFGSGTQAAAEYLAAAWGDIGADVELRAVAAAAYSEALFSTGDWDASIVPLGLSLPSQLIGYLSGDGVADGGSNFADIANQTYTDLATEAAGITVDDGGCDIWAAAESALFETADVVPVTESTSLVAARNAEVVVIGGLAQPTRIRLLES